jgi:two-component system, cell cycle sensor histidine kinase and response regulator CckA
MSLSVQSLRERAAPDDAGAEGDLLQLEGAIDSAYHIARELISIQATQSSQPTVADVNEIVAQLEGVLARTLGSRIRLSLRLDAANGMVEAEAVQLEWVLLNLAANARDAMPKGGLFEIQTALVTRRADNASYVRVTVTDTGPGLSEDVRARAFEPFVSTREGHAGLGLTSVALIVRRFGGWIDIDSDAAGTRVHIHLPSLSRAQR